jgi:hypothetical protein
LLTAASVIGLSSIEGNAARPAPVARPEREQVELFAGIAQGQLDVKIFPRDSRESRLMVANRTERPLAVVFPDSFAAVPVVAQFQNAAGQPHGNKEHQPIGMAPPLNNNVGGPMFNNLAVPGGNNLGAPAGNRFFFNLEPEKVGQLRLRTVCLAYGKAEPNPRVPYELRPFEAVHCQPGVRELCRLLATTADQKAVQAAAWHLNNGLTWEQLKNKRNKLTLGLSEPIFTARELKQGRQLAETALKQGKPTGTVASSATSSRGH